jgi:hypothetical protein
MSLLTGTKATGRDSIIATGWDVDDLVRRASNIYLEMVFRDGVYHPTHTPATSSCPTDSTWPSWTSARSDTSAAHERTSSKPC